MRNTKEPLHSYLIEPFLLKEHVLLKEHAVAQYLAVSVQKIRVMRKNGEGPRFIKIGKSIRYTIASLQDYILSLSNAPKEVLVDPKELTSMAPKEHHVLSAMPMIDPNKEAAQKVLLQDIFKPSAIDFFD